MAISIPRPDVAPAPEATPAIPGPSGLSADILRARVVAFGSLGAFVLAVVLIVATTGGARPNPRLRSAPAAVRPHSWIIRPGQTLSSIAARRSVDVGAIMRLNPQVTPGTLRPGQRIRVPG